MQLPTLGGDGKQGVPTSAAPVAASATVKPAASSMPPDKSPEAVVIVDDQDRRSWLHGLSLAPRAPAVIRANPNRSSRLARTGNSGRGPIRRTLLPGRPHRQDARRSRAEHPVHPAGWAGRDSGPRARALAPRRVGSAPRSGGASCSEGLGGELAEAVEVGVGESTWVGEAPVVGDVSDRTVGLR
jgi:hypothetical protein